MPQDANNPRSRGGGIARPDADSIRLQDRIMQVSRFATIGEMAAGVAHELNQPLTAISNYARACEHILRREDGRPSDVLEALQEIASEAGRAAEIIRRLRSLVPSQPAERVSTDLNELVTELAELLETDARVHDVKLSFELGRPMPNVVVDRIQVQHVILNLMRNALEAIDGIAGPREIVVQTQSVEAGEVELSVADTGPGVAPQVADRLFTPFLTTKLNGTGLGLATSQTIVRAHDGTIGHRPNPPRGACFYMRISAGTE